MEIYFNTPNLYKEYKNIVNNNLNTDMIMNKVENYLKLAESINYLINKRNKLSDEQFIEILCNISDIELNNIDYFKILKSVLNIDFINQNQKYLNNISKTIFNENYFVYKKEMSKTEDTALYDIRNIFYKATIKYIRTKTENKTLKIKLNGYLNDLKTEMSNVIMRYSSNYKEYYISKDCEEKFHQKEYIKQIKKLLNSDN